ncbi:MAG: DUF1566 domain-containing protein [Rhodanobacteraceae bacterium]|nr:DUF1566 domain-containing protein [Rhodanobacteraceae bacterium]
MQPHRSIHAIATALLLAASPILMAAPQDTAPTSQEPSAPRFELLVDGTVRDTQTGLVWPGTDNSGDIDWATAKAYCQTLGTGWQLPTVAELLTLFETGSSDNQPCTGQLTCKVTPLIKVTGLTPWSNEANGETEAWYIYFTDGKQYSYHQTDKPGKRALCVKRP